MSKKGVKRNLISVVLTSLIIGMLIFSGPVYSIDVSFKNLPTEIDISNSLLINFSLEVQINDG